MSPESRPLPLEPPERVDQRWKPVGLHQSLTGQSQESCQAFRCYSYDAVALLVRNSIGARAARLSRRLALTFRTSGNGSRGRSEHGGRSSNFLQNGVDGAWINLISILRAQEQARGRVPAEGLRMAE